VNTDALPKKAGSVRRMASERFAIGGELPVDAMAVLRSAVDRGVTLIDTTDVYGPSIAEELIAQALHPYPAKVLVATKGGVVRTDRPTPGTSTGARSGCGRCARRACGGCDATRSTRISCTDSIHASRWPNSWAPWTSCARRARCRHLGLDSVTAEQLGVALELMSIASGRTAITS